MEGLLTETADYETPGSWGPASAHWPSLPDADGRIRSLVIRARVVPYGAYVTVGERLRVHPGYFEALKSAAATAPAGRIRPEGRNGESH